MRFLNVLFFSVGLSAGFCIPLSGQESDRTVASVKVIKAISEINALVQEALFDQALMKATDLLAVCEPDTIDSALANLLIAQVHSSQDRYAEAIPHLEAALNPGVLDRESTERYTLGLAHLYEETGAREKAVSLLDSFMAANPFPGGDILYMHSVILLHVGRGHDALGSAERALRTSVHPRQELYQLAAACAQEVNNYELACAYLERMLEMDPQSELLWTQLMATYLAGGKLHAALVALEGAQARGLMQKPENNVTRVELYYNLERYKEASELLEKGLLDGSLPDEQRLWEMLSYCYDLLFQPEKATDALERASRRGAWSAIDIRLAERYWQSQDYEKTILSLQAAWDKGGVDRPGDLWLLMASAALELEDLEIAEKALFNAREYPDSAGRVERLQRYIQQIKEHKLIEAEDAANDQSREGAI